jgi:thiosulfate/3-mercaptopyruvate sulfurtransferase
MAASNGYARQDALVGAEWVAAHREDPNVRLVEVDVNTNAYDEGHIPGAVGWNWQTQLQRRPVRDFPSADEWAALVGQAGIGPETQVVLYGDNHNWFAAYAYWLFALYGHTNVYLLNGGRQKWLDEGRPVTTDVPAYPAATYPTPSYNASLRALRDDILRRLSGDGIALVDVRSPGEYSGELLAPANLPQEGAQRSGHIPGAKNIPWSSVVGEDGTFKSASDLTALYGGQGVTPDKDVFTYCRIGERSAHTWFVLTQLLGYPTVRNYDGSWTEWGSLIGAPIEV